MKVGLTFDLRDEYQAAGYDPEAIAEFDSSETIDAIETALSSWGHQCERIGNVRELASRLTFGQTWDLIFNIAEGLWGVGREAQVPALLDAYRIPYTFSDPVVLGLTLHKGLTKHVVRDLGIPTPSFATIESVADAESMQMRFPLFVKPVAEGSSKGITANSIVHTPAELVDRCSALLKRFAQPALVESYLPGREFTIGVVGTGRKAQVLGVMEITMSDALADEVYSFANKTDYETRVRYQLLTGPLADEAADVALRVWRGLGCRDAGRVDVRCDGQGWVHFLEVNPLAGLNPQHSDLPILCRLLNIPYRELIGRIITSASERLSD